LVLLTDGMLEGGAAALDLQARLQHLSGLHPREVVRILADLVLDTAGPILLDDACLLLLDWHGGHGDTRYTNVGADRASTPRRMRHTMRPTVQIDGVVVAALTRFEAVAVDRVPGLCRIGAVRPVGAVMVAGTTGEFVTMSEDERIAAIGWFRSTRR
jgi:hypothetical protein